MSSSSKKNKELMELDLYEILKISIEATNSEIKKAFRKRALICHPDKNPDNPEAATQFDRLKKILEVLLDPGSRSAYDRVLKGRKRAAVRARETSAKTQKLKDDLHRREKEAAQARDKLSDADRFARELSRLEAEGAQLIAEEVARMEREAEDDRRRVAHRLQPSPPPSCKPVGSYKVKVRWVTPEGGDPYTQEQIHNLCYKWGEINAIVLKQKGSKGTALVDYKNQSAVDMSCQFEKGLPSCPVTVAPLRAASPSRTPHNSATGKTSEGRLGAKEEEAKRKRDYETLADMEKRRKNERARLISDMLRNDGVDND